MNFTRMSGGALLVLVMSAGACAQIGRVPDGTQLFKDLEYVAGGHERNKLDIYLPANADSPLPLIVWVHGGAWKQGSKDLCPAATWVANGYAVASINYRFLKHAPFPAQIEDCKAAIRWLRANAKQYHIDPAHVGVMGASAGGQLVALLGTDGEQKDLEGSGGNPEQSSAVQAVVDLFGPMGIPGGGEKGNPITFISKSTPPFLIVHGDKDTTVDLSHSQRLNDALKAAGIEVTLVVKPGAAHGGPEFRGPEDAKMYIAFFDKHLKGK